MAPSPQPSDISHRTREEAEVLSEGLPALMVDAERVANTVAQGIHGRRRIGIGETFWEYRHHRPQDPLTAIDWRQSAKSDHLYVRENEWEAAESVWLWCDGSASMNYQSDFSHCTKHHRASILTLAVGCLLVRGGERIAQIGSAEPPTAARHAIQRMAHHLTVNEDTKTSLPLKQPLPRFAQMVWVSDFLTPIEELEEVIYFYASRGVKGHLVQVLDPAEEDLPFTGRTEFEDLEDGRRLTFGRVESIQTDYQKKLAAHREGLEQLASRFGWSFTHHRTDKSAQIPLMALYMAIAGEGMFGPNTGIR